MRWLAFLLALSGATQAAPVSLAWDPVQDSRLTGYELGWGSATRTYSQYRSADGTTSTLDLSEPGPWHIAVRAVGQHAGVRMQSAWSNEVEWRADVVGSTIPLAQTSLWARYEPEELIMAIPESVLLYTNWEHGSLVSTTYTQATPEIPNGHTWTFRGSIAAEDASPWNGQYLANFAGSWTDHASTTVSSSTVQATSGRFLIEVGTMSDNHRIMNLEASDANNGRIRVQRNAGNLEILFSWNSWNSGATVGMGTFPTSPFGLEIIYDANNATANQRLRARTWTIGGTPGSFTNATSTSGSAATTNQFTSLTLGRSDDTSNVKIGRTIFSNSITEDLSLVSESAASLALPIAQYYYNHQR